MLFVEFLDFLNIGVGLEVMIYWLVFYYFLLINVYFMKFKFFSLNRVREMWILGENGFFKDNKIRIECKKFYKED